MSATVGGLQRLTAASQARHKLTRSLGASAGAGGARGHIGSQQRPQARQQRRPSTAAAAGGGDQRRQAPPRPSQQLYIGLRSSAGEDGSGATEAEEAALEGGRSMAVVAAGGAALAAALVLLLAAPLPAQAFSLADAVGGLEELVQSAGAAGPLVFILAYAVATVVLVPASLLTLAAGFLFGPALGTAVVSVASTAGACAAFLVGRYLARPAVEQRIAGNARFSAVDGAIGRQGARIVLLLRLSPLFPFTLLNYALSLTSIEFGPYALASWAGMLPGTVAYVALGGAGKAAAETAAGGGAGALQLGLYAVGAAATLGATVLISRAASKALEEATEGGGGGGGTTPLRRDSDE